MNTGNLGRYSAALGLTATLVLSGSGCKNLPGTPGQQGAGIGGLSGAAVGAAVGGEHHRLVGALLGGALGAGGGYLIGANKDRITGHDTAGAEAATQRAQSTPATPQQALNANTADLNGDGFVTMDEVVAMKRAGLTDQQILQRMQVTGQVFELTPEQQNYLRTNGVDEYVIGQIPELNRQTRNQLLSQPPPPPAGNPGLNQPVPPPPPQ
ncbi:MAG TPA: glycine zipper domain-containing protein [Verrucomicrobiae bacterium]|nr:glycine zipper domain-containing protein [Verrucomicrobiae bacterium]